MPIRSSTNSNYLRVLSGIRFNLSRLVLSQEQVASGRRILRPSDDPGGTTRVLSLNQRLTTNGRYLGAIELGRAAVDTGASALENGSSLLADAREKLLQGMNGSVNQDDRETLAQGIELIRSALLEVANTRFGDRTVFGGTSSGADPWESRLIGGIERAVYVGNGDEQQVRIGDGTNVGITLSGAGTFAKDQGTGTVYAGLTGAAAGLTADEGSGREYLTLRHDATNAGTIGTVGLALAGGGASDTFLGSQTLVVDPVAGTVQLGGGPAVAIPQPGDPDLADFTVTNAAGGELHLDFSVWGGAAFNGTVSATGSISIDGTSFVPIDFSSQDTALVNAASGNTIHVDATGITRAGTELVTFGGRVNVFDALQGIADDLRNPDGLDQDELLQRLDLWMGELDRNHDNLLVSLGTLGSRSERLTKSESRLGDVRVQLEALRSQELDVDLAEAALDLARAQQSLELAQASGVRLLQTNLLNFLR